MRGQADKVKTIFPKRNHVSKITLNKDFDFVDGDLEKSVNDKLENLDIRALFLGGSHAYGTQNENSDVDIRGIFQVSQDELFRVHPLRRGEEKLDSYDFSDPDMIVYELGRFTELLSRANPNALELLWAPELHSTPLLKELKENRTLFLSQRIYDSYGGYAMGQLRHARQGTGGSRGKNHYKREKFVLHLFRLLDQGKELLETGHLTLPLKNIEELKEKSKLPLEKVEKEFMIKDQELQKARDNTSLPLFCNMDKVDDLLIYLRKKY